MTIEDVEQQIRLFSARGDRKYEVAIEEDQLALINSVRQLSLDRVEMPRGRILYVEFHW